MKPKHQSINWPRLISWVIGVEIVGLVGAFFTIDSIDSWYRFLDKPIFSPPNWLFGPVWTILYAVLGVVGYRLWHIPKPSLIKEKRLFIYQLILNGLWTPVFFGLKRPDWAFIVIVGLLIALLNIISKLWSSQKTLALWLIPYLLWVSYASLLNFFLWWQN